MSINVDLLKVDYSKYENPLRKIIGRAEEMRIAYEENSAMAHITQTIGYEIDKTELIRALNYDRDQFAKGYKAGLNADRWISVNDRLPEIGQRVLVTYNQENKLKVDTTIFDRHGFLIGVVTAWMPLPKPYCGEVGESE